MSERVKYWQPPNDGAKWKCDQCGQRFAHTQVTLIDAIGDKPRAIYCNDCLDEDWKKDFGVNMGTYPLP